MFIYLKLNKVFNKRLYHFQFSSLFSNAAVLCQNLHAMLLSQKSLFKNNTLSGRISCCVVEWIEFMNWANEYLLWYFQRFNLTFYKKLFTILLCSLPFPYRFCTFYTVFNYLKKVNYLKILRIFRFLPFLPFLIFYSYFLTLDLIPFKKKKRKNI